jgi:serine protease Do
MARRASVVTGVLAAVVAVASLAPWPAAAQGTLSQLQTDVDQIARRARPAVVTVFAQRQRRATGAAGEKRVHTRVGSGVAIEESAVLTTASVVLNADRLLVRTANGLQVEAELVGLDPVFNIALISVPAVRLPVVRFGDGGQSDAGDWVISLGTSYRAQPTQSVGTVALRHREPYQSLLQLTNTVYPGNSGAAALNARGELIGIIQGELGTPQPPGVESVERRPGGASFALPVEMVRMVYQSLKRDGRVAHGFLGVTTRAASVESEEAGGRSTPIGAVVEDVVAGGPAARAGLRRGDLLVAYAGERVEYPEQLARWVAATPPGTPIDLVWVRDETAIEARAAVGTSPDVSPRWIAGDQDDDEPAVTPTARISDLEKEIRRLSDELARVKKRGAQP